LQKRLRIYPNNQFIAEKTHEDNNILWDDFGNPTVHLGPTKVQIVHIQVTLTKVTLNPEIQFQTKKISYLVHIPFSKQNYWYSSVM
jgi:hypothetical protein